MSLSKLHCDRNIFRDAEGRMLLLRGVNLGGDSKVPTRPDGRTFLRDDFAGHRAVSFVDRPFPLAEADRHFARLAHWGFNCVRLLTTWEAVEHAGPGEYDEAYLDYFASVCAAAGRHGLYVFVDFHQDVWSRMSGGDGAPGWTFESVGLDFVRFDAADAAHVMQHRYDAATGGRQPAYPVMSWSGNYHAPANAIMWTLFFAGEDFAPALRIGGRSAQRYLQDHYLGSMAAVARRVADQPHVIGFDTLNEPGEGWIGRMLDQPPKTLRGLRWTPLDALAVASGCTRIVQRAAFGRSATVGEVLNPHGVSIWLPGRADPFREAGVWDIDAEGQPVALRPDHFSHVAGRPVDAEADYLLPFFGRVADTVTDIRPDWLIFAEVSPFSGMYEHGYPDGMPANTVNAPHWYDYNALVSKQFNAHDYQDRIHERQLGGPEAIEDSYVDVLSKLQRVGDRVGAGVPTLIGECGYQFDMNDAEAYRRHAAGERGADVWRDQIDAQDIMYNAFDRLLLNSTQWNYTASNRNDAMIGDGWNQEDLSIFSLDQATDDSDPDSGGRAIDGFCRPSVRRTQGRLIRQTYSRRTAWFEAELAIDPAVAAPSEVYLPRRIFGDAPRVDIAGGDADCAQQGQVLLIAARAAGTLRIRVVGTPAT